MSSIEERLARDIAAVTGGVVVTDSDLRDARTTIDERIQESSGVAGRRRAGVAAAAAAVLLPVLGYVGWQSFQDDTNSAPVPADTADSDVSADDPWLTGEPLAPDQIVGAWRVDNGTALALFRRDGTVQVDDQGLLFSDPGTTGTYEVSDGTVTVAVEKSSEPDCTGTTLALRASVPGTGALRFVTADSSSSSACAFLGAQGALEQLLPLTFYRGFLDETVPDESWAPAGKPSSLHGIWLGAVVAPASSDDGLLLQIAPDRTYVVAAGSGDVVDRGRWDLRGDRQRQLTFVSAAESPMCEQGDRLVLTRVEHADVGTPSMRAEAGVNTCGEWGSATELVLLPNATAP